MATWKLITKLRTFNWDLLLKIITASCFLLSLIFAVEKAYNNQHLSSLNLLLVSFFSAFINDRITVNRTTPNS